MIAVVLGVSLGTANAQQKVDVTVRPAPLIDFGVIQPVRSSAITDVQRMLSTYADRAERQRMFEEQMRIDHERLRMDQERHNAEMSAMRARAAAESAPPARQEPIASEKVTAGKDGEWIRLPYERKSNGIVYGLFADRASMRFIGEARIFRVRYVRMDTAEAYSDDIKTALVYCKSKKMEAPWPGPSYQIVPGGDVQVIYDAACK